MFHASQDKINKMNESDAPLKMLTLNTLKIGIDAANYAKETLDLELPVNAHNLIPKIKEVTDAYNGRAVFSAKQASAVAVSLIEMTTFDNRNYFSIEEVIKVIMDTVISQIKEDYDTPDEDFKLRHEVADIIKNIVTEKVGPYNVTFAVVSNNLSRVSVGNYYIIEYLDNLAERGLRVGVISATRKIFESMAANVSVISYITTLDLTSSMSRKLYIPKMFNDEVCNAILTHYGDVVKVEEE